MQGNANDTMQNKKPARVLSIDSTELHTWFERDRAHVELRSKLNDATILEFWDEAVNEAIDDGFLNPKDYHSSIYEYAESIGMLPVVEPHYIAMSGMSGYMPDYCEVYESHKDAVDSLCNLFELGRTRRARLKRESYLKLTLSPIERNSNYSFGAEYCEVTECNCDSPADHSDSL